MAEQRPDMSIKATAFTVSEKTINTYLPLYISVECPQSFEPKVLRDGTVTCKPCGFGYYKKKKGDDTDFCSKCKKDRWTLFTGTRTNTLCLSKLSLSLSFSLTHSLFHFYDKCIYIHNFFSELYIEHFEVYTYKSNRFCGWLELKQSFKMKPENYFNRYRFRLKVHRR